MLYEKLINKEEKLAVVGLGYVLDIRFLD